jgi:hypothetical protein
MRHWRWGVAIASATLLAGAITLSGGTTFAQQPSPTPAAPTAAAGGPTPPNRFYGSATLDGRPAADGAAVVALVGTTSCGTGQVSGGQYVVDVASAFTRPGCGTDGGRVTFRVGTAPATQTGTFQTGAFTQLNLTAQTPTPTPTPTRAATPTATAVRTATPAPTVARTATPAPTVARTATPAPTAAPAAQRPAAAPALPRTGAAATDSQAPLWLALAALALLTTGGVVIARRR